MRGIIANATVEAVRALVVSNMLPDGAHPERGRFVRDQVQALRLLTSGASDHDQPGGRADEDRSSEGASEGAGELEVELFEFAPGARSLVAGARELRRRHGGKRFDVVHAHFGLSAYPAFAVKASVRGLTLHGTDLAHPRTRLLTRAVLPAVELVGVASAQLLDLVPGPRTRSRARVLPCGVDMRRFEPMARAHARRMLELDASRPYLLFPADPARAEKRVDRARVLAGAVGAELLTLGGVSPERVPLYVNAADAVVIPSEREGFGLAALEALACDVPVLATPVGAHPQALEGVAGCLCAPFDLERWQAALAPHLRAAEDVVHTGDGIEEGPRVQGRSAAERFSAERMAQRLADAWRSLLSGDG